MQLCDEKGRLFGRVSIVDIGLILLILLVVGPAVYFALEIRSAAPYISQVEPIETIISPDKNIPLVVHGKWFDAQCVTRLANTPLITVATNTQRLDLLIPTQEVTPGYHLLTVTNRRGLSAQWKKPVLLLSKPPKINKVQQIPSKNRKEVGIILAGENFDKKCGVYINHLPLKITSRSSTRMEARWVLPPVVQAGTYPVQVINNYGQSDQLDNAVYLSPPPVVKNKNPSPAAASVSEPLPPMIAPAAKPKRKPVNPEKLIPVEAAFFFTEPETLAERKHLESGVISYNEDMTRPISKIQKILRVAPASKNKGGAVLAVLVLACQREAGQFLYEGDPVEIGTHLQFRFRSLNIEGTMLTYPVLLDKPLKKYLKQ